MKRGIIALIALIAIFSVSSIHSTYAYFNQTTSLIQNQVNIGDGRLAELGSANTLYHREDIVFGNNQYYIASRTSQHKEPGRNGSQNFGQIYTF